MPNIQEKSKLDMKSVFSIRNRPVDFFVIKNYRKYVTTYLWERDVQDDGRNNASAPRGTFRRTAGVSHPRCTMKGSSSQRVGSLSVPQALSLVIISGADAALRTHDTNTNVCGNENTPQGLLCPEHRC